MATITYNPGSWPTGDPIWAICQAVATAEGANISGSRPDRDNNPGDVTRGDEWGQPVSGYDGIYIIFANKNAGWAALYAKFQNIAAGGSLIYSPTDTWYGIGESYSFGSGDVWAENVAAALGVDPSSTMAEYLSGGGAGFVNTAAVSPQVVLASPSLLDEITPSSPAESYLLLGVLGVALLWWFLD